MRKPGPGITDVCVSEAPWAILPEFITTRSYWSSQEGNSCNVPFLHHSTAMAWFTASYLFHSNSSRVANGFCDFVLCFCQWLLFVSLLLLRAINITLCSFGQPTACLLLSDPILLSLLLALFLIMSLLRVFPLLFWLPAGMLRCLGGGSRGSARAATGAACQLGSVAVLPQPSTCNRGQSCQQAGKGIPAETHQPAITLWQLIGEHETHILLWKVTQTKFPLFPFPHWHNLRKERHSRVSPSQLRESFQEGSVSSVFRKHWAVFLFCPSSQRPNYLLDNVVRHLHFFLLWYLARGFGLKLV